MVRARRHVASALGATVVGVLPVYLFGGLAPLIRRDLAFDGRWIGIGVAVYFAASAVASVHGGRLGERLGSRRTMRLGIAVCAAGLAGTALLARNWPLLVAFLVVGGVANAVIQPAANLALARGVPERRRGLAFGLKQAAIPTAAAVGGFAVPLVGVTVGWRFAFLGAAALALLALGLPTGTGDADRRSAGSTPRLAAVPLSLYLLMVGIGLSSAAGNSMGAYLVEASVVAGWDAATAGLVLGAGSVLGIAARVGIGWVADRMRDGHLALVAALMGIGSLGYAGLVGLESWPFLVAGTAVAFVAGWGVNGLFAYSIVRLHPEAPAAATGVTLAGAFGGSVIGPPLFGVAAAAWSYAVAWGMAALLSALGGVSTVAGLRRVRAERRGREATAAQGLRGPS